MSPYSEEYAPIKDVPVATDCYGVTTILVCHQMLWFGTKLNHSLINPNQLRLGGTSVFDDPTQKKFGIELSDSAFIAFEYGR